MVWLHWGLEDPALDCRLARGVDVYHTAIGAGDGAAAGGGEEQEGRPLQGAATWPAAHVSQARLQQLNV